MLVLLAYSCSTRSYVVLCLPSSPPSPSSRFSTLLTSSFLKSTALAKKCNSTARMLLKINIKQSNHSWYLSMRTVSILPSKSTPFRVLMASVASCSCENCTVPYPLLLPCSSSATSALATVPAEAKRFFSASHEVCHGTFKTTTLRPPPGPYSPPIGGLGIGIIPAASPPGDLGLIPMFPPGIPMCGTMWGYPIPIAIPPIPGGMPIPIGNGGWVKP
mmetsp:Transcript_5388/g.20242  ORF Transcript_5388/g.20242 Transcript_5388/m.20242 type:complete len:217 (+) Transcript_5388:92-742(+)